VTTSSESGIAAGGYRLPVAVLAGKNGLMPAVEPESHDEPLHDDHHHSKLVEAAIEAEFETGEREDTVEEAKAHILLRLGRITLGFIVLLAGIAAIPLPGPGWLIVAVGLGILAQDFLWAERTLNLVRKRLPQDGDGRISTWTWVVMGITMTGGIALSIWWSFLR
jgi:uncharacterized protein (TIGR02611 family)